MPKQYFQHDFYARTDPKISKLRREHGLAGYGFYWCIVELLFEQGGYLDSSEIDSIAYDLRAEDTMANDVISKYGLFEKKGKKIYSQSVLDRLKIAQEKTRKAIESANARWKNNSNSGAEETQNESNANDMQTQCERIPNAKPPDSESNAIKSNKTKLNKNKLNNNNTDSQSVNANDSQPDSFEEDWLGYFDYILDELNKEQPVNGSGIELLFADTRLLGPYTDVMINLISEMRKHHTLKINDYDVYVGKIAKSFWQYYFLRGQEDGYSALNSILGDIEDKFNKGEIKNRFNYTVSTLYNTARNAGF